jgi:hypothetical protein
MPKHQTEITTNDLISLRLTVSRDIKRLKEFEDASAHMADKLESLERIAKLIDQPGATVIVETWEKGK